MLYLLSHLPNTGSSSLGGISVLPFDNVCVFFSSPVKNKKPTKIFCDKRSFKQSTEIFWSSFQKKILSSQKKTEHNFPP